tara:strand:+ start:268 stop:438 length:171 start_codon:yes stop_codon:yes gene_type:complete
MTSVSLLKKSFYFFQIYYCILIAIASTVGVFSLSISSGCNGSATTMIDTCPSMGVA